MPHAPASDRLKAVLDTNIYIAAFNYPKGRTAALWIAALEGRFRLLASPEIIREMAGVLQSDFRWEEPRVQKAVRIVAQVAEIVTPRMPLQVISADPDDDRILECARAGKADLIVSNDHHLLDLKIYGGIPIVAGPDFRRTLGLK